MPRFPTVDSATDVSRTQHRVRIHVQGAVQGVGFRPYIYRLATRHRLSGWVQNSASGVVIEIEGDTQNTELFLERIRTGLPVRASIHSLETTVLEPQGLTGFAIRESDRSGTQSAVVLPDIATCPDCLREIRDPRDRRYLYPFTNCTNCGPRFSIIAGVPYDRASTTMRHFTMCDKCRTEYHDPMDRRFHAQPNACPDCGPHLEFWDAVGRVLAKHDEAIHESADRIRAGEIVAVKGLGGFHLIVDARNDSAVQRLRYRKHREEKPLALMYPQLTSIERDCFLTPAEKRLLQSPEAPIVLLSRRKKVSVSEAVAAPAPTLGVMLPYTPLHHLLMAELGFPIIATSGNLSDEPICTDEYDALDRLHDIADTFLVHNRPIARHVDDSIVRIMCERELVLRRARGYAPLPLSIDSHSTSKPCILAVGAHLKNTVALACSSGVVASQHIGDLETREADAAFVSVIDDLTRLYAAAPEVIVHDQHPDYHSTLFAKRQSVPTAGVQHHHAHIAACMADNGLDGRVLGVAWDGAGYGSDGTIWGGEFLDASRSEFSRMASLRPFRLPGGEAAMREPRRSALGLLYPMYNTSLQDRDEIASVVSFTESERRVIIRMLESGLNSPVTSSCGRLFDAIASILGLIQKASFEGQAAMLLEYEATNSDNAEMYPFNLKCPDDETLPLVIDWDPMVRRILNDVQHQLPAPAIARQFHNTLAGMIVEVAKWHQRRTDSDRIVLSGGCFQNRILTESTASALKAAGLRPYWHQRIPPNDGGIAVGQIAATLSQYEPKGRM